MCAWEKEGQNASVDSWKICISSVSRAMVKQTNFFGSAQNMLSKASKLLAEKLWIINFYLQEILERLKSSRTVNC